MAQHPEVTWPLPMSLDVTWPATAQHADTIWPAAATTGVVWAEPADQHADVVWPGFFADAPPEDPPVLVTIALTNYYPVMGSSVACNVAYTGTEPVTIDRQWQVDGADLSTSNPLTVGATHCFAVTRTDNTSMGLQTTNNLTTLPSTGTLAMTFDLTSFLGGYNSLISFGYDGTANGLLINTVSSNTLEAVWYTSGPTLRWLGSSTTMPEGVFTAFFRWSPSVAEFLIYEAGVLVGTVAVNAVAGPSTAAGKVKMFEGGNAGTLGWAILSEFLSDADCAAMPDDYEAPHVMGLERGTLWGSFVVETPTAGEAITPVGSVLGGQALVIPVVGKGAIPAAWETEAGSVDVVLTSAGPGLLPLAELTCGVTATNAFGSDTGTSPVATLGTVPVVAAVTLSASSVLAGATVTMTPTFRGTGTPSYEYRWKLDGSIISGATAASYVTAAAGSLVGEARATTSWGTSAWVASSACTVSPAVVYGVQRANASTSDTIASVDNAPALPTSTWTWLAYVNFSAYGTSGSNCFAWSNGATSNTFGMNMVTSTTPDRARMIWRDTTTALRTLEANYPSGVDINTYGPHLLSIVRASTGAMTVRIIKGGVVVATASNGTNLFGNGSASAVITAMTNMAGVMSWAIGDEALAAGDFTGMVDATSTPRNFFNGRGTLWAGWQVSAADEATIDPATNISSLGSGLSTAWTTVGSAGGLTAEGE